MPYKIEPGKSADCDDCETFISLEHIDKELDAHTWIKISELEYAKLYLKGIKVYKEEKERD